MPTTPSIENRPFLSTVACQDFARTTVVGLGICPFALFATPICQTVPFLVNFGWTVDNGQFWAVASFQSSIDAQCLKFVISRAITEFNEGQWRIYTYY